MTLTVWKGIQLLCFLHASVMTVQINERESEFFV